MDKIDVERREKGEARPFICTSNWCTRMIWKKFLIKLYEFYLVKMNVH